MTGIFLLVFKKVSTVETRVHWASRHVGVTKVINIKDAAIIVSSISFVRA